MLNHIVIMGRLARDPEVKILSNNVTLTQLTVAVDRDYQKEGAEKQADFIPCRAWRQTGEFIDRYFQKGSMIILEGSLESSKWTDSDGKNRVSWYINVTKARFGEAKKKEYGSGGEAPYPSAGRQGRAVDVYAAEFTDLGDDGELPF